jgi:hypothetical protein
MLEHSSDVKGKMKASEKPAARAPWIEREGVWGVPKRHLHLVEVKLEENRGLAPPESCDLAVPVAD